MASRCVPLPSSIVTPFPSTMLSNRAFNRLTPATLAAINHLVVQAAVELDLEDGKQLRVDTTVVETNVHHPTDATLLWDTVPGTVTRLVDDLDERLPRGVKGFTNRTRSARRRMQALQRMTVPAARAAANSQEYRELIRITEQVLKNTQHRDRRCRQAHPQSRGIHPCGD